MSGGLRMWVGSCSTQEEVLLDEGGGMQGRKRERRTEWKVEGEHIWGDQLEMASFELRHLRGIKPQVQG